MSFADASMSMSFCQGAGDDGGLDAMGEGDGSILGVLTLLAGDDADMGEGSAYICWSMLAEASGSASGSGAASRSCSTVGDWL